MSRNIIITILYCISICFFSITGTRCTNISDSSNSTYKYIKDKKPYYYRKDTLHFFYPREGFEITFQGKRLCTLTTINGDNSTPTSSTDSSDYFIRYTTGLDTFLMEGDTVNGAARFSILDIKSNFNWDYLLKKFPDTILLADIIFDYLDTATSRVMTTTDSGFKLSPSHKDSVISALNKIVNSTTIYRDYKTKIDALIWDPDSIGFHQDLKLMIDENIMDIDGNVNNNLTFLQKERLKRFNYNLYTKHFDTNPDELIFTPFPVLGKVYSMKVEEGESLQDPQKNITRVLKVNDTSINQLFYVDNNGKSITPQNNKLSGYYPVTGLNWNMTPIFMDIDIPLVKDSEILNIINPGNAIIYFDSLVGPYENAKKYYRLISNHSISGTTIFEDGKKYYISGFISLTAGFYNLSYGNTMYSIENDRGHFTFMNIDVYFHAKNIDNKKFIYHETRVLETDSLKTERYY